MRSATRKVCSHPKINKSDFRACFDLGNHAKFRSRVITEGKQPLTYVRRRKQGRVKRMREENICIKGLSVEVSLPPKIISLLASSNLSSVSYSDCVHLLSPSSKAAKLQCSKLNRRKQKKTIIKEIKTEENILEIKHVSGKASLSPEHISLSPMRKVATVLCCDILSGLQLSSKGILNRYACTLSSKKKRRMTTIKEIKGENVCEIENAVGRLPTLLDVASSQSSLKKGFREKAKNCKRKCSLCLSHSPALSLSDSCVNSWKPFHRECDDPRCDTIKQSEKADLLSRGDSGQNLSVACYLAAVNDIKYRPNICLVDCFQERPSGESSLDCKICMKDATLKAFQGKQKSDQAIKIASRVDSDHEEKEENIAAEENFAADENYQNSTFDIALKSDEYHLLKLGPSTFTEKMPRLHIKTIQNEQFMTSLHTKIEPYYQEYDKLDEKRLLCHVLGEEPQTSTVNNSIQMENSSKYDYQKEFLSYLSSQYTNM